MTEFKLTTKADWEDHWSKHELFCVVPENFSWHEDLKKAARAIRRSGSVIELGGFPGYFSVYFKKFCGLNVSMLDYIIDRNVVEKLFEINGLQSIDLGLIEADIFSYKTEELYDLVCSFGLIEHFSDLGSILNCHLKFMKPDGVLLITLPNFIGVNGWLQSLFDPENLSIHNLKIMDRKILGAKLAELGLKNIEVDYYPSTQVWIEGLHSRGLFLRILIRLINRVMTLLAKIFGKKNRWLSNSIVLRATR